MPLLRDGSPRRCAPPGSRCGSTRANCGAGTRGAGNAYPLALQIIGETERARTAAAKVRDAFLAREPGNTQRLGRLRFAYLVLDENAAALETADKNVNETGSGNDGFSEEAPELRRAQLLAWLGRKDEALSELNRLWWQPIFPRDPLTSFMWSPLHGDPRFEAIKNDPRNSQPLF